MSSVDQIFKEFGLPVPSPLKDDEAYVEEWVQAREGGSCHVPDGTAQWSLYPFLTYKKENNSHESFQNTLFLNA